MVGYHYTSAGNYGKILVEGLRPYRVLLDLDPFFPRVTGVWLWRGDLSGDEHAGSVLWQVMTKDSAEVVKLRVTFDEADLLRLRGSVVEVLHEGRLGKWRYHHEVPAVIATRAVEPAAVELVGSYDVRDLLR